MASWANYNPANKRIATASSAPGGFVYDASGNTLNDGNNEYWYDAEGLLCAVQSLRYTGAPVTQNAFVLPILCYLFIAYFGMWGSKPTRSAA
jgi:hypothetical protein